MSSTDRSYFDEMYARSHDPWEFATSTYERRKYALTVASLPEARFRAAFEPGCAIGVLTAMLAPRCARLLATDIVPAALAEARRRVRDPHVTFARRAIPEHWPEGPFDLVVLSEIAYYFDRCELEEIVASTTRSTVIGAVVVGVHWRGPTNYPLSGDAAHEIIDASPALERVAHYDEAAFVLDLWRRRS